MKSRRKIHQVSVMANRVVPSGLYTGTWTGVITDFKKTFKCSTWRRQYIKRAGCVTKCRRRWGTTACEVADAIDCVAGLFHVFPLL